ncbi:MAG: cupin domain-containing protein [Myxococcota bacterium]
MTTIKPNASQSFVDVSENRDSLEPRPARVPDDSCVHRQVTTAGDDNDFSGQRGHPVFPIRLPSASVSLSIGELDPGATTSNHRHAYESLIYVIAGRGYTVMEGQRHDWQAGDAIYVPPWCWHLHGAEADGRVQYITATNMPLLGSLGQTVLRQEEG